MRENHPRRRQALKALKKQTAKRGVLPQVLLGCEGLTERAYFEGFCREHRLGFLTFAGEGSDPKNLLAEVEKRFEMGAGDFQAVFCVFDRDDHFHFEATCRRILEKGCLSFKRRRAPLSAVVSNPSFELWLLLHFEDVRGEVDRSVALKRLKKYCPHYEKADLTIYPQTHAHLEIAIARASRLESGKNPSTDVGTLVLKLRELWNL